jgi:threonine/homoserine/homoserine lactone efflux protein
MGVLPGFFDLRTVTPIDIGFIVLVSVTIPLTGNLIMAGFVGQIRNLMSSPSVLKKFNIGSGVLLILVGLVIAAF